MTFSRHNIMIAAINLSISLFQNARPIFFWVLADSKNLFPPLIHRQCVINFNVSLSRKHVQLDHKSTFFIYPFRTFFVFLIKPKCLFEIFFAQNCKRTNQVTIAYLPLLYIIRAYAIVNELFFQFGSSYWFHHIF